MFVLRQTSVKMAVLLHKQAKVPFIMIIAVKLSKNLKYCTALLLTAGKAKIPVFSAIAIYVSGTALGIPVHGFHFSICSKYMGFDGFRLHVM